MRTFQIVRAFSSLIVLENLLLAVPGQRGESPAGALLHRARVRTTEGASAATAREVLQRVGLWSHADARAGILSGGQRKLLELARALVLPPRMIMLDEPAAGVSPPLLDTIIAGVRELRHDGIAFVLVKHDTSFVGSLCDQVHVLAGGQPLVCGSFADVTADRRVLDAYLGAPA